MKKIILSLALLLAISPITASAYTVKPGDTLWKIAKANNTTWQQIAEDNNIENPNLIFAGQELSVGQLGAITPQPRLLGDNTWTGSNTFSGTTTGAGFYYTYVASTTGTNTVTSTWSVPTGVTKIKVKVVGGGANGSNGTIAYSSGGTAGGGGGGYCEAFIDTSATTSIYYTIGGVSATSSIGNCIAGGAPAVVDNSGIGGTGGVSSGGYLNINGGPGGYPTNEEILFSGKGGDSPQGFGFGGRQFSSGSSANGLSGSGYGAGGSGVVDVVNGSIQTGGSGTAGIIIIEY